LKSAFAWTSAPLHPEPLLQPWWRVTQISVLLLPFSSLLGSVGLVLVMLAVWRQRWQRLVRQPLSWGFCGLSLLLVLSAGLAPRPVEAAIGLLNFLPFFPIFLALREVLQTPAQLRRLAWILVASAVPVVAIGLAQFFLRWGGQIQFLWIVLSWNIDPNGTPPGRMASIFFYANVLASYLVVIFSLSLGLWLETWQRFARPVAFEIRAVLRQQLIFLTLTILGIAIALILTNSRNAWAITVIAALAFALYIGWRWLVALVGVVAAVVLGAAFAPPPFRQGLRTIVPAFFWARLSDELYPDRPVNQLRSTQWHFTLALAQQRPWTGWGLRSFGALYQAETQLYLGHPHNLLLMLLAETGWPATLLLVVLVGWVMVQGALYLRRRCERNDRRLLFSYLTAFMSCALFSSLDVTLFDVRLNALGWLLLAAIAGVAQTGAENHSVQFQPASQPSYNDQKLD
jgi:O-antigen ligase